MLWDLLAYAPSEIHMLSHALVTGYVLSFIYYAAYIQHLWHCWHSMISHTLNELSDIITEASRKHATAIYSFPKHTQWSARKLAHLVLLPSSISLIVVVEICIINNQLLVLYSKWILCLLPAAGASCLRWIHTIVWADVYRRIGKRW